MLVCVDGPVATGARYDGNSGNIGGSDGTDSAGDAWLRAPHPRPHRIASAVSPSSSSSSLSSDESDSAGPNGAGDGGRRHHHHDRHRHAERWEGGATATDRGGGEVEEAPVVVGQGVGLRKGSGLFGLKGERVSEWASKKTKKRGRNCTVKYHEI